MLLKSDEKNESNLMESNGIAMKMLISQEISKETNSINSSPNLVAKLMGLDSFPNQQSGSMNQRSLSRHQRCHSEISIRKWEQQNSVVPHEYTDVHELWSKSLNRYRFNGNSKHISMAFVRQKFIEAKRLSMDTKLRQSKQFEDVILTNKELFLKCLQEPVETKRITVLRPSKTTRNNGAVNGADHCKQVRNGSFIQLNCFENGENSPPPSAQLTRIVVLKPSNGKIHSHSASAVAFLRSESSRDIEHLSGSAENSENLESRSFVKAITETMCNKLGTHRTDEKTIYSAISNGYLADESSFNKSEVEVQACNLSDSGHSWDYVNRIRSPVSSSSYSPESSVFREAKKYLSERWSRNFEDQDLVQKTTSTLGEMLALFESKNTSASVEENYSSEPKDLKSLFYSESRSNDDLRCEQRSLVRSKSCDSPKLNSYSSVSDKSKLSFPEVSKTLSSSISSFRGKVASLFFSRNNTKVKTTTLEHDPQPLCCTTSFPKLDIDISLEPEVSVFDTHFEATEETERHGSDLPLSSGNSNLIDKSPSIGSIPRISSQDYSSTSSTYRKEEEFSSLLNTLLSVTGIQGEVQSSLVLEKWHSPFSPLDPSLREKYIESNEKGTERRRMRSMQKLVFDYVNAGLIEIGEYYASGSVQRGYNKDFYDVFSLINSLFNDEKSDFVRTEAVGNGWGDKMRVEMDIMEIEIGDKLMEEVVEEIVVEFTG